MPKKQAKKHLPLGLRKPPTVRKGRAAHSKQVLDRIQAARRLRSTVDAHKEKVIEGYRARVADELRDGEAVPDLSLALELACRSVETAVEVLQQAELVYCRQTFERQQLKQACDRLAQDEIHSELVEVRRAINARYGHRAGRRIHGMEGPTLRKPARQLPQLEGAVEGIRERLEAEEPQRPLLPGESRLWRKMIEPGYQKLSAMLAELEEREVQETVRRKDRDFELECFDLTYGEAVDLVRTVLRSAGLGEKVIRHLLSTARRRQLAAKARRESEARAEGRRERTPDSGENG